jgi:hypothetical protein
MSETPALTVPTAFNDISQLAEGMSDRVDEERLMLYGPGPVDDNSWVRFSVLLMDQSIALEGIGRAVASIDGGEERPEVARFDIVLDNLQFEGTSEVVYERMLVYRSQAFADGPGTGEVSTEDLEAAEAALIDDVANVDSDFPEDSTMVASADEYAEHVQATVGEPALPDFAAELDAPTTVGAGRSDDEDAPSYGEYESATTESEGFADVQTDDIASEDWGTGEVDVSDIDEVVEGDLPPSAPPPAPPQAPKGFTLEAANGALTRPSRGATWTPNLALAPDPRAPSGLFPYAGGLPIPQTPPRPELDPSYRIKPAPRPVEGAGEQTDLSAHDGYEEATPMSEPPADLEPIDSSGLDYEDDYASEQDDAASFDDLATEVVADDSEP